MKHFIFRLLCLASGLAGAANLNELVAQGKPAAATCIACHDVSNSGHRKVGPPLWGVFGRPIASVEGFPYSPALQKQQGKWDSEQLDIFLSNPIGYGGGPTGMTYPGIASEDKRLAIIAFLSTLDGVAADVADFEAKLSGKEVIVEEEDWQGLPEAKGREKTFYTCNACHSMAIVKQQHLSMSAWDETLEWMVEEQGMDELNEEDKATILQYLTDHYGPN